ncbi:MAG: hypothetical protein AABX17_02330 [Nanoarchaeota archaeon]
MFDKKIKARVMFEMIGRPKEHLKKAMADLIEVIGKEKVIVILNKKIHEPKQIEKEVKEKNKYQGEMFSTFAEVEMEFEQIITLFGLCFRYLPSHVEIIYPENFNVDNLEIGSIANEIINRIHHYDSIAKTMLMQNSILSKRVEELIAENRNKSVPTITFADSNLIKKEKSKKKKK